MLLTFLSASDRNHLKTYAVPLPSRLQIADEISLGLHDAGSTFGEDCHWEIFQDLLHSSDDPLALDGPKYLIAALACLNIIFGRHEPPTSRFKWLSQHCRTLRIGIETRSRRHHIDLPVGTYWDRTISAYWHFRTRLPNRVPHGLSILGANGEFTMSWLDHHQPVRSKHLQFLLEKSAYSDNILDFARYRVFRFGYLARQHPVYMKEAIFSLAKYIRRVTGETAEVRACESIWGRDRWFPEQ